MHTYNRVRLDDFTKKPHGSILPYLRARANEGKPKEDKPKGATDLGANTPSTGGAEPGSLLRYLDTNRHGYEV